MYAPKRLGVVGHRVGDRRRSPFPDLVVGGEVMMAILMRPRFPRFGLGRVILRQGTWVKK